MTKLVTYNKNIDRFIEDLIKKLNKKKVELFVSATNYVKLDETNKSNGYFCDYEKRVAIAIKKPLKIWLGTLVHESCHFDQWVEQDPTWIADKNYMPDPDVGDLIFHWLDGKKTKAKSSQIKKCIDISKALELNNEKRTYEKIKEYNLPINLESYAKRAGAYISFYDFIKEYRTWYKIGKEPYTHPKILALMPTVIQDHYNGLTPKLIKLFKECI